MSELDLDNLVRIVKIITNATGTHTIDYNHISSALRIINPDDITMYTTSAYDTWILYQAKKVQNAYFNKAKAMLQKDNYRVKSDAAAYLSGIIILHDVDKK
jgi:hypothetical protein